MSHAFNLEHWMTAKRAEVNALLATRLPASPADDDPGRLVEAMRYSLLSPGKRLRPLLALGAAEAVGSTSSEPIRLAAAAVEAVHCYSLIHDDLPAMDDDDVRRGQPSNHKAFGEATAILAGDALLTLAFEWLAEAGVLARTAQEEGRWARSSRAVGFLHAARALARAAGMSGMVRGQARDLKGPKPKTIPELETLHREKTGALFRAALEVGALSAGAPATELAALRDFGDLYGVAFQHADDLADGEHGGAKSSLKPAVKARVNELATRAAAALEGFGPPAEPLRALARALVSKQER